jgi:hypothetical protein
MSAPSSTSLSEDDPIWNEASAACSQKATELLGDDVELGESVLYAPHPYAFASGGTTAYCTFFTYSDPFTGSAVQHTLTQPSARSST